MKANKREWCYIQKPVEYKVWRDVKTRKAELKKEGIKSRATGHRLTGWILTYII